MKKLSWMVSSPRPTLGAGQQSSWASLVSSPSTLTPPLPHQLSTGTMVSCFTDKIEATWRQLPRQIYKLLAFTPVLLDQGSPTPGPRTGTGLWPVRNRAAQLEVSGRWVSEASFAAPHCLHYRLNHPPCSPSLWKNCLPRNRSVVPKMLGTAVLDLSQAQWKCVTHHLCIPCPKLRDFACPFLSPFCPLHACHPPFSVFTSFPSPTLILLPLFLASLSAKHHVSISYTCSLCILTILTLAVVGGGPQAAEGDTGRTGLALLSMAGRGEEDL